MTLPWSAEHIQASRLFWTFVVNERQLSNRRNAELAWRALCDYEEEHDIVDKVMFNGQRAYIPRDVLTLIDRLEAAEAAARAHTERVVREAFAKGWEEGNASQPGAPVADADFEWFLGDVLTRLGLTSDAKGGDE